jgi:hypothetical protein
MMQAVLCAGLSLSIVLASWVGLSRARALDVRLGSLQKFPNPVRNVDLRLPPDWPTEIRTVELASPGERQLPAAILEAMEPEVHFGARRNLHVCVSPAFVKDNGTFDTADEVLEGLVKRAHGTKSRFDFLGQPGVIAKYPAQIRSGEAEEIPALVVACVVIPGPRPMACTIWLDGLSTLSTADIHVLEKVAASVVLDDPPKRIPEVSHTTESIQIIKPVRPPRPDNPDPD